MTGQERSRRQPGAPRAAQAEELLVLDRALGGVGSAEPASVIRESCNLSLLPPVALDALEDFRRLVQKGRKEGRG